MTSPPPSGGGGGEARFLASRRRRLEATPTATATATAPEAEVRAEFWRALRLRFAALEAGVASVVEDYEAGSGGCAKPWAD